MKQLYWISYLLLPIALWPFHLALTSLIIDAHSSLFNTFILPRFTPSFLKLSSTSFIHLSLGRPLPLLPSNFPSKIFFRDSWSHSFYLLYSSNLYYCHNILGFIFGSPSFISFNYPLSILLCRSIYFPQYLFLPCN